MRAQDTTGAPSGAPTAEQAREAYARVEKRFPDLAGSLGWSTIGDYLDASQRAQTLTLKVDTSAVRAELDKIMSEVALWASEHSDAVRELDVALNGEIGAPRGVGTNDRLRQLAAQVRAQQPAQILNMADGMRINFRAPDGRRGTLNLARLLDAIEHDPSQFEPGIGDTMRAAIAAYPVAGALHQQRHGRIERDEQALGACPEASTGFDSDPVDDGGIRSVIAKRYEEGT